MRSSHAALVLREMLRGELGLAFWDAGSREMYPAGTSGEVCSLEERDLEGKV